MHRKVLTLPAPPPGQEHHPPPAADQEVPMYPKVLTLPKLLPGVENDIPAARALRRSQIQWQLARDEARAQFKRLGRTDSTYRMARRRVREAKDRFVELLITLVEYGEFDLDD